MNEYPFFAKIIKIKGNFKIKCSFKKCKLKNCILRLRSAQNESKEKKPREEDSLGFQFRFDLNIDFINKISCFQVESVTKVD